VPRSLLRRAAAAGFGLLAAAAGCTDLGDPVPVAPPNDVGAPPVVTELVPFRTFAGDTVVVVGSDFGDDPAAGTVLFGGDAAGTVVSWADDRIEVLVPAGVSAGAVRVRVGGQTSDGIDFTPAAPVSYRNDLVPLFRQYGCSSCHGGSGGLRVEPWVALVSGGSDHGPVVIPRRSGESLLRERLLPSTPVAQRMPQGGPYLSPEPILLIADWIDQGARDN